MILYPELEPGFSMPADDDPRFELASELLNTFKELRQQILSPMQGFGFAGGNQGTIKSDDVLMSRLRTVALGLERATGFHMGVGETGIQLVTAHLHSPYGGGRRSHGRWGRR